MNNQERKMRTYHDVMESEAEHGVSKSIAAQTKVIATLRLLMTRQINRHEAMPVINGALLALFDARPAIHTYRGLIDRYVDALLNANMSIKETEHELRMEAHKSQFWPITGEHDDDEPHDNGGPGAGTGGGSDSPS